MKEANREADRWLRQAENDLAYAAVGLREGFAAQVCFQCQQVCEKAIKALRYGRGERAVLGHALVELAAPLEVMARFREELGMHDHYYVPTRYPNGLPGGIPADVYTRTQATEAVGVARRIIAVVRRELARSSGGRDASGPAEGRTPPDAAASRQGTAAPAESPPGWSAEDQETAAKDNMVSRPLITRRTVTTVRGLLPPWRGAIMVSSWHARHAPT